MAPPGIDPGSAAGRLIQALGLEKIPQEGPWFALTYRSADELAGPALPARYAGRARACGSAILGLQTPTDFSALHRLQTDEVWHFYAGAPLELLLLHPGGRGELKLLGADVARGPGPAGRRPARRLAGAPGRSRAGAADHALFRLLPRPPASSMRTSRWGTARSSRPPTRPLPPRSPP